MPCVKPNRLTRWNGSPRPFAPLLRPMCAAGAILMRFCALVWRENLMEPLEEKLKKIAGDMSKGSSVTSSSTDPADRTRQFLGDPNCPICGGVGFVRRDLPVDHPDFGKSAVCTCRQSQIAQTERQRLYRLSNLDAFQKMTFETFKVQG